MWSSSFRRSYTCFAKLTPASIAAYTQLPSLPQQERFVLHGIAVYNYNSVTRKSGSNITLAMLHQHNPALFPEAKSKPVSPVRLIGSSGLSYQTPLVSWPTLLVMYDAILLRQGMFLQNALPISFTSNSRWLCELAEAIDADLVEELLREKNLFPR